MAQNGFGTIDGDIFIFMKDIIETVRKSNEMKSFLLNQGLSVMMFETALKKELSEEKKTKVARIEKKAPVSVTR